MRGCTDAFHLSSGIWGTLMSSPVAYIGYTLFSLVVPKSSLVLYYWPAFNWAILAMFILHSYAVVVPVCKDWWSLRQESRVISASTQTLSSQSQVMFAKMLGSESEYEKLRAAAVEEFSTENPLYWETYTAWMHYCFELLAAQTVSDVQMSQALSAMTGEMIADGNQLRVELTKPNSSVLSQYLSMMRVGTVDSAQPIDVPLPRRMAAVFVMIYRQFVEEGSAFELNIPDAQRKEIAPLALELQRLLNADPSSKADRNKPLAGCLLRFGHRAQIIDGQSIVLPATIFDKIKVSVLHSLFTNTFPRCCKKKI
jgi:hypothetical protein